MPNCANCMSFISLRLVFPKVALILKTFTFAPYCYPYTSVSTAILTRFSTPNLRLTRHSNTLATKFHAVGLSSSTIHSCPSKSHPEALVGYSNRKISTGRILDAERAGSTVAAMLIASAAAAIHKASNPLA
jgi:hypothetical protein